MRYGLYVILLCNPFLSAVGVITMRKMKKFHDATVSWYLNWTMGIVALIMILALRSGFAPIGNFDGVSWTLSFLTGLIGVTTSTLRFVALRYQQAAKLQKLAPLSTLWQVITDVTIFSATYTWI